MDITNKVACRWLAIYINDWTVRLAKTGMPSKVQIYVTGSNPDFDWIECAHFDPFVRHNQAFELLKNWKAKGKKRGYELTSKFRSGKTRVHLFGHLDAGVTEAFAADEQNAICLALLKATGYAS